MTAPALFVYGSLRKGAEHPMHEVLREHGRLQGPARTRGRLYVVDWYPGIVLDENAGWVVGELWSDVAHDAWPVLDFYEGCSAEDPQPHEYARRLAAIESRGAAATAWVYEYARDPTGLQRVHSGDWLRRSS